MKVTIDWEANGSLVVSNDRSRITVQPDGTIAVSSEDPVQLTGACLAKLDVGNIQGASADEFLATLRKRIEKKR